jgi:hypothetical protein
LISAPDNYEGVCAEMDFGQVKGGARRARLGAFCGFSWPCAGGSGSATNAHGDLNGAAQSRAFNNKSEQNVSGPIS